MSEKCSEKSSNLNQVEDIHNSLNPYKKIRINATPISLWTRPPPGVLKMKLMVDDNFLASLLVCQQVIKFIKVCLYKDCVIST